jgi:hypothetical protein
MWLRIKGWNHGRRACPKNIGGVEFGGGLSIGAAGAVVGIGCRLLERQVWRRGYRREGESQDCWWLVVVFGGIMGGNWAKVGVLRERQKKLGEGLRAGTVRAIAPFVFAFW